MIWILRTLITLALQAFEFPFVRLILILCFGAVSKTFATLFIDILPMDSFTHKVFDWLQRLALLGFCVEVIRYVLEDELGISINKLLEYVKQLFKSK